MAKLNKQMFINALALVAGAAVASKLNNIQLPAMIPDKFKPLLPVATGFFVSGMKSPVAKHFGAGMIAFGGVKAVGAFVPQLGIGDADDSPYYIEGPGDNYALAGPGAYALAGPGGGGDMAEMG